MKKFKFNFNHIKKNLNFQNFIKHIYKLEGDKYGGGDMFYKVLSNSFVGNDFEYEKILDDYEKDEIKEFKLKINKYQFNGTLLPKLHTNFKLEHYFDFGTESHYLIFSKLKKNYLYIFCQRQSYYSDNPSIYFRHDTHNNYVKKILKKKMSKLEFFKFLMKRDKKEGLFLSHHDCYTSTKGTNYYELYLKGKLK